MLALWLATGFLYGTSDIVPEATSEPVGGGGPALSKPAQLPSFRFRPRLEEPLDRSWFNEPQTEEERRLLAEAQRLDAEAAEAARVAKSRLEHARRRAEQEETAARFRAVASAERAAIRADAALEIARLSAGLLDEEEAIALLLAA